VQQSGGTHHAAGHRHRPGGSSARAVTPGEAIELAEKGIRLSPTDPRLSIWLPALAGAYYQLRQYEKAVEIGRRSWTLNRDWPAGLRYVVAGLAELDRIEEAQAPLAELKRLNTNLAFVEGNLRRLFTDEAR